MLSSTFILLVTEKQEYNFTTEQGKLPDNKLSTKSNTAQDCQMEIVENHFLFKKLLSQKITRRNLPRIIILKNRKLLV